MITLGLWLLFLLISGMIVLWQNVYIIMKPPNVRGDATKIILIGAISQEIYHFKNSPYISYGEAI